MPKRVEIDGQIHEFPDDFTDADIQLALGSNSPTKAPAQRPYGSDWGIDTPEDAARAGKFLGGGVGAGGAISAVMKAAPTVGRIIASPVTGAITGGMEGYRRGGLYGAMTGAVTGGTLSRTLGSIGRRLGSGRIVTAGPQAPTQTVPQAAETVDEMLLRIAAEKAAPIASQQGTRTAAYGSSGFIRSK